MSRKTILTVSVTTCRGEPLRAARVISLDVPAKRLHRCEECDKCFRTKSNLESHFRCHTGERPFVCAACGKGFSESSSLRNHSKTHSEFLDETFDKDKIVFKCEDGEKPETTNFSCTECPYSTHLKTSLQRHLMTHTGDRPHRCPLCDQTFSQKVHLQGHIRHHTGENPYVCNTCGKGFRQVYTLRTHEKGECHQRQIERQKADQELFSAPSSPPIDLQPTYCAEQFINKVFKCEDRSGDSALGLEKCDAEKPETTNFTCTECPFSTHWKTSLQRHLMTHTGDRPHQCPLCDKTFTQKPHLQKHLRHHTGKNPYVCDTCGKGFRQVYTLRTHKKGECHQRKIERQKPEKPDQELFSAPSSPPIDLQPTYCAERPHQCPVCNKTFALKKHVKTHLRMHTGEKPYTCDTCRRGFNHKTSLIYHLKRKPPCQMEAQEKQQNV